MKPNFTFLLLAVCFIGTAVAKSSQTDANKPVAVDDGKIVLHQIFNPGTTKAEISSLKRELKMLRKDVTQLLERNKARDPWIKLNTAPVCFGARGDQFGEFSVPFGGRLLAIKLVHLHGYVTCDRRNVYHWSYWGCGAHGSVGAGFTAVVLTTSTNGVLLPPKQFFDAAKGWKNLKWSKIPGYNSLSPELVLSVFSSPLTVTSGQVLRLWFGEDLVNSGDSDNDGTSCSDVFARFM